MPFMQQRYCSNEDYAIMAENLKYKFVKKGHYIMRQGQKSDNVYFIVKGSVNVIMWGEPDKAYLNKDQMYNECSLQRSKTKKVSSEAAINKASHQFHDILANMTFSLDNQGNLIKQKTKFHQADIFGLMEDLKEIPEVTSNMKNSNITNTP